MRDKGIKMPHLGNKELVRVFAKHDPYYSTGHLGEVVAEMKVLGPPTINVIDYRGDYYALEGSHRLAAAYFLGLVPNIKVLEPDRTDPVDEKFWDHMKDSLPSYAW